MSLRWRFPVGSTKRLKSVLAAALLLFISLASGVAASPLQASAVHNRPIGKLTVDAVTHDSITVSWREVHNPEGYVISWWTTGRKKKTRVDVPVDGTSYTVERLEPETKYTLRVYNAKKGKRHYKGRSELLIQQTLAVPAAEQTSDGSETRHPDPVEERRPDPLEQLYDPRNAVISGNGEGGGEPAEQKRTVPADKLAAADVTDTSVALIWPATEQASGYMIMWYESDGSGVIRDETVQENWFEITDLQPTTGYRVIVTPQVSGRSRNDLVLPMLEVRTEAHATPQPSGPELGESQVPPPPPPQEEAPQDETILLFGDDSTADVRPAAVHGPQAKPPVAPADEDAGEQGSVSVVVVDDGAPFLGTLSIAKISPSEVTIPEGWTADFRITATPAPPLAFNVNVEISQVGSYVKAADTGTKVVRISEIGVGILKVPTQHSEAEEADGSVTVRILAVDGYKFGQQSETQVIENDPSARPVVTVAVLRDSVQEGQNVDYRFDVSPQTTTGGMTIYYTLGHTGYFSSSSQQIRSERLFGHTTGKTLSTSTVDDRQREAHGPFTLTVQPHPSGLYRVGEPSSASGMIYDNDGPVPTVSVTPVADDINEGVTARFTVASSAHPDPVSTVTSLTLPVVISQHRNVFAGNQAGTRMVTVPIGGSVEITADTEDDSVVERDGTVNARLVPGDGYKLDTQNNNASVQVKDNDAMVTVWLRPEHTSIDESMTVKIFVEVSPSPLPYGFEAPYVFSQEGKFSNRYPYGNKFFRVGEGYVSAKGWITVRPVDDNVDEPDGSVTFTFSPPGRDAGYVLGNPHTVTIQIADND